MVHGIIQEFYTATKGAEKSIVRFLVKSEQGTSKDVCTVCAEIPNDALKYDMVKAGSTIGWEDPRVYIEIEGVEDIPFTKVDNSVGDEITFFDRLRSIIELEERGSKGK